MRIFYAQDSALFTHAQSTEMSVKLQMFCQQILLIIKIYYGICHALQENKKNKTKIYILITQPRNTNILNIVKVDYECLFNSTTLPSTSEFVLL